MDMSNEIGEMGIQEDVVFKIHNKGYFDFDPLRYVNGSVTSVCAFTCDRDMFPGSLDYILSEIKQNKWALFYCLPNKSLENGLTLMHTDTDVHKFFDLAERNGSIHLFVAHKKHKLAQYYLRNMFWIEEDASLRCSTSSPFSTRLKRKFGVSNRSVDLFRRKKDRVVIQDEGLLTKTQKAPHKGKEIFFKDEGVSRKESKVVVTNYKRAVVNGKAIRVEADVDVNLMSEAC
ncbi:hypothetical protein Tco_1297250 [Tanacetum coccineum]